MPRKLRELVREIEKAGFQRTGGRGSHRKYKHPLTRVRVVLSGGANDDAKPYQERDVAEALRRSSHE